MIMLFAVAGMMYWNSLQAPPVQQKTITSQESQKEQMNSPHFSEMSASALLKPSSSQAPNPTIEPAQYSHTLEETQVQQITFNTHGQLETWTLLEEQYLQKKKVKKPGDYPIN